MYRLFGLSKGIKVQPEIYIKYSNPDSLPVANRIVSSLHSGDHDFEKTLEIEVEDQIQLLHIKASVIRNVTGDPIHVLGIDVNITERREAERQLRRMEAFQQQQIFQITLNTQEEERRRISESLHNGLGQLLYGIKLSMNYLTQKLAIEMPEKYIEYKKYSEALLTEGIHETRRISHELMPTVLAEFGLSAAVKEACGQLEGEISFNCSIFIGTVRLENYLELAIFRTVQELMINVGKHSRANNAIVRVFVEQTDVIIEVNDDGEGMPSNKQDKNGIGLISIRNKVDALRGTISIISSPGKGTSVKVRFPIC